MAVEIFALAAVGLIVMTSLILLVSADWRWSILALAGQYLGVFFLVWLSWPLEMAVVKLVAGWMAGAVLGSTRIGLVDVSLDRGVRPVQRLFRFLASGLFILAVFSLAPTTLTWIPQVRLEQVWGALLLMGMGLLHLGLTSYPYRVILALLTTFAGFEILYAVVESSTLVAGLLAGITLGLAMVGAYLMVASTLEEAP